MIALPSYPAQWLREAACIGYYETRGQSDPWHTLDPPYAGRFQFTLATFNSAGTPYRSLRAVAAASPAEQTRRAYVVWSRGRTWRNDWPATAIQCEAR